MRPFGNDVLCGDILYCRSLSRDRSLSLASTQPNMRRHRMSKGGRYILKYKSNLALLVMASLWRIRIQVYLSYELLKFSSSATTPSE
jgi:hypothetical protein